MDFEIAAMTGFQNRTFVHAPALGFKDETSKEIHEINGRQIKVQWRRFAGFTKNRIPLKKTQIPFKYMYLLTLSKSFLFDVYGHGHFWHGSSSSQGLETLRMPSLLLHQSCSTYNGFEASLREHTQKYMAELSKTTMSVFQLISTPFFAG